MKFSNRTCESGNWKLSRMRTIGELLFLLRSIDKNMPWFRGQVFIVLSPYVSPPSYLRRDYPKLKFVTHDEFIPKDLLPTFSTYTIYAFLHRIPNLPPTYITFDDDYMIGKPVTPSVFLTAFGGPQIYFENSWLDYSSSSCKKAIKKRHIWRQSMCHTSFIF